MTLHRQFVAAENQAYFYVQFHENRFQLAPHLKTPEAMAAAAWQVLDFAARQLEYIQTRRRTRAILRSADGAQWVTNRRAEAVARIAGMVAYFMLFSQPGGERAVATTQFPAPGYEVAGDLCATLAFGVWGAVPGLNIHERSLWGLMSPLIIRGDATAVPPVPNTPAIMPAFYYTHFPNHFALHGFQPHGALPAITPMAAAITDPSEIQGILDSIDELLKDIDKIDWVQRQYIEDMLTRLLLNPKFKEFWKQKVFLDYLKNNKGFDYDDLAKTNPLLLLRYLLEYAKMIGFRVGPYLARGGYVSLQFLAILMICLEVLYLWKTVGEGFADEFQFLEANAEAIRLCVQAGMTPEECRKEHEEWRKGAFCLKNFNYWQAIKKMYKDYRRKKLISH